jgi:BlaI family transcriptional regulator, penicillinase repressor
MNTYQPSEAELEILQIIWEIEPASVRDIHERITAAGKTVGYTTVLKQIQRLTEKGALEKEVLEGAHLYRALVKESAVKGELAGKVLRNAFGGSALQMMMHALGNEKTSPEELQELKNWLDNQISKP